jgi:hypothetical protein
MSVVHERRDKRGTYVAHILGFPPDPAQMAMKVILAGAGLFGAGRASWTIGGNVN